MDKRNGLRPKTLHAVELFKQGMPLQEIEQTAGVTRNGLYHALDALGIERRRYGGNRHFAPKTLHAIELFKQSVPTKEIEQQTGVARQNLYTALDSLGIERKRVGQRLFTDEEKARIIALHQEGLATPAIGQIVDRAPNVVRKVLLEANVFEKKVYTREKIGDQIDALFDEGLRTPEITARLGISPQTVLRQLETSGREMRRAEFRHNDNFWDGLNSIAAYWLGFMLADGCVLDRGGGTAMSITTIDKGHIPLFIKDYGAANPVREYHLDGHSKTWIAKWTIYPRERDLLATYGMRPRKSWSMDMTWLLSEPAWRQRDILRGFWDGDGHAWTSNGEWGENLPALSVGVCGTLSAMRVTRNIIGTIVGFKPKIGVERRGNQSCHYVAWTSTNAFRVAHWLYCDAERFLPRKMATYLKMMEWFKDHRSEVVESLPPLPSKEVFLAADV